VTDVLPAPEEKAIAVRRMFDRIAPGYDRVNRVMTGRMDQRWRRDLFARLGVKDEDIVLDLACGTGDFAEIAREYTAHVIGLDFAREMLMGARRRKLGAVQLAQGDALRLPLAEGSITVAVSGFALRNFSSIPPVLAELARVVRPGGRIGLLEVDRPRQAVIRTGHSVYFNRVVPFIGGLLSDRKAYTYLPASAAYMPPETELLAMVRDAGFRDVQKKRHMLGAIQSITAVRA
jgi:demethylmenaquinone methyltransferase / 2-methoxy-6-polyprenyl-1,4-benzoquinol methylase